jgi:hypothetical protein
LLAGAHDGLGFLRIVPEGRIFDFGIQAGEGFLRSVKVKDASSAAPATA